jgi:hypothetical protein
VVVCVSVCVGEIGFVGLLFLVKCGTKALNRISS